MIKINSLVVKYLIDNDEVGIYTSQGACIDEREFIIVCQEDGDYLAHISEFEQNGVLIRLKNEK